METTNYLEGAEQFLKDTGTTFKITHESYGPYFAGDKESRDIYRATFRRRPPNHSRELSFSVRFGQTMARTKNSEPPDAYDVLACLTKSDPGTFENFCDDTGYNTDIKALKTYKAVLKEWAGVKRLFGDVLEKFREIQ